MQKDTITHMQIKEDFRGPIENFNSVSMPKLPYRIEGVFTLEIVHGIAELAEKFQSDVRKLLDKEVTSTHARVIGKLHNGEPIDRIDDWDSWLDEDMSEHLYGGLAAFITILAHHAGLTVEEEVKDHTKNKPAEKPEPVEKDIRETIEDLGDLGLKGALSERLSYERALGLSSHMYDMTTKRISPLSLSQSPLWDICQEYHRISDDWDLRNIQEAVLVFLFPNDYKISDN